MKSNEMGVRGKCVLRVVLGSRNCARPGRLCVGPQYVENDMKIQRAGTVRRSEDIIKNEFNRLTPNDLYMSRTAPLTSKRCILYIYSTNIGTEYFTHALYSLFFLYKMQFVS